MEEENVFELSQSVFDKLHLLNFQKKFATKKNASQLLPPDYFAIESNSSEQFDFFKNTIRWLFAILKIDAGGVSGYSDPNTICTNILDAAEKTGMDISNLQPLKLKGGYGIEVCKILDFCLSKIINDKGMSFKNPVFPAAEEEKPSMANQDDVEDELEVADNINVDFVEDNDEVLAREDSSQQKKIIETNADEREWYKECERVANRLLIDKINERNEWRMHVDLSKSHTKQLSELNPKIVRALEKVADNVQKSLQKITANENMLNNALSDYFADLKGNTDKKKEVDIKIKNLTQKVKDLTNEYNSVNTKCDDLQKKLNEQNDSATNDEALIKIRRTIDDIKAEVTKVDIRIGVLSNLVMNKQFRDKRNKLEHVLGVATINEEFDVDENLVEELV